MRNEEALETINADDSIKKDLEKIVKNFELNHVEKAGTIMRLSTLSNLRNYKYGNKPKYLGFVFVEHLEENRRAYTSLREKIQAFNPESIFVVERGGVLIGEALVKKTDLEQRLVILPKIDDDKEMIIVDSSKNYDDISGLLEEKIKQGKKKFFVVDNRGGSFSKELNEKVFKILGEKYKDPKITFETGIRDYDFIMREIQEKINSGQRKFVIADFYVGGRFSSELRDNVIKKLIESNNAVDLEFEIYWIRETFGIVNMESDGRIKQIFSDQDVVYKGLFSSSSPYSKKVRIYSSPVRVSVGDDVDFILENSNHPIIIFNRQGDVVKILSSENPQGDLIDALI